MRRLSLTWMTLPILAALLVTFVQPSSAEELAWNRVAKLLRNATPVDVIRPPDSCDTCQGEVCVQRVPVTECVTGKKLVYDVEKRYEYVTIAETRHRFVTRWVTKEVKCDYCQPYCESYDVDHRYETERWDTQETGCGELHCRSCVAHTEQLPCQHCGRKPGETIVKARVKECVEEPYVVYRQVRRQICVKTPRYEKVNVSVTRHVCCDQCGGRGCNQCGGSACSECQ